MGVDDRIHKVLITRDSDWCPNTGPLLELTDACFPDLRPYTSDGVQRKTGDLNEKRGTHDAI